MPIEKILWAISIYGVKTQKGLVELRLDDKNIQVTPEEARDFAHNILEAAEAAQMDEFFIRFVQKLTNDDDLNSAKLLLEFRRFCDEERRKHRSETK